MRRKPGQPMETLREAIDRLDARGYRDSFRAERDGLRALRADRLESPEDLIVDEVVRFEGESDPQDMAVLFALRSADGTRGTFVTSFGAQVDPDAAEMAKRLDGGPGTRSGA